MRKLFSFFILAALFLMSQVVQAQSVSTYHLRMASVDTTKGAVFPAPGNYIYYEDDTVNVGAEAKPGYVFIGFYCTVILPPNGEIDTLGYMVTACAGARDSVVETSFVIGPYYGDEIWVYEAVFIPDTATITFGTNDANMGTVNPGPGTYRYPQGDTVYLTAVPKAGYELKGWITGQLDDSNHVITVDTNLWLADYNPYKIGIDLYVICPWYGGNRFYTALFGPKAQKKVQINVVANYPEYGTVTGGGVFNEGDTVTVTAKPSNKYCLFDYWSNWFGEKLSEKNPYSFIATDDETIVAHFYSFEPDTFDITVAVNDPSMGTTVPAPGVHKYLEYDSVVLKAVSNPGCNFAKWTDEEGVAVSYDSVLVFGATTDLKFTANFVKGQWIPDSVTLTIAVNDPTMGTTIPAPGKHVIPENSQDSIVAVPNKGYYFYGWAMSVDMYGTTYCDTIADDHYPVYYPIYSTMVGYSNNNIVITAVFTDDSTLVAPDSVYITFAVNSATMGTTIPAPGTYAFVEDEEFEVKAVAYEGYKLMGWTATVIIYGQEYTYPLDTAIESITGYAFNNELFSNYTITAVFGPANFSEDSVTVVVGVSNPDGGTVSPAPGVYQYGLGDSIYVIASAKGEYKFTGWHVTLSHPVYGTVVDTMMHTQENTIGPVVVDNDMLGFAYTFIAMFGTSTASEDSLTLIVGVNDPNMGSVTPAPGTYHYGVGDRITITASANMGYKLTGWHVALSHPVYGAIVDTVIYSSENVLGPIDVEDEMVGFVYTIQAIFARKTSVGMTENVSVNVYGSEGSIYLTGAEGRDVFICDINGRILHSGRAVNSVETYNVSAAGIYIVKVAGIEAKRVVVYR